MKLASGKNSRCGNSGWANYKLNKMLLQRLLHNYFYMHFLVHCKRCTHQIGLAGELLFDMPKFDGHRRLRTTAFVAVIPAHAGIRRLGEVPGERRTSLDPGMRRDDSEKKMEEV